MATLKDNINSRNIGNRKIIIELRFDHNILLADKKGSIIEEIISSKILNSFHWEIGIANIVIWDSKKKEDAYNSISIELNRLSYISRKVDSISGFYERFKKLLAVVKNNLNELNIQRIGCRIQGTYKCNIDNYNTLLDRFMRIIPQKFLLDNYPANDCRFELTYRNGMYNLGPVSGDGDPFLLQNFNYEDSVKHLGFGIDTDNYLTNMNESINDEKLIEDVFVLSLSVEKDLYTNISKMLNEDKEYKEKQESDSE